MSDQRQRTGNSGEDRKATAFKTAKARMHSFSDARREAAERLHRDGDGKTLFPAMATRSSQGSNAHGNAGGEPGFPAQSSNGKKRFPAKVTPPLRMHGRSEMPPSSSADAFYFTPYRDVQGMEFSGYPGDPPIPKNTSWLHDPNVTSFSDQEYAMRTYTIPARPPMTAGFRLISPDGPRGSAWNGIQFPPKSPERMEESLFSLAEAAVLGGGALAKRGIQGMQQTASAPPLPREVSIHVRVDRKNWEEPLKDLVMQVALQLMKEGYLRKPSG